jgi:hypothetical protein
MTGCCSHTNCGGRDCALCDDDVAHCRCAAPDVRLAAGVRYCATCDLVVAQKKSRGGFAPCVAPQLRAAPHDSATTRVALLAAFDVLGAGDHR